MTGKVLDACYWFRRNKVGLSGVSRSDRVTHPTQELNRVVVDEAHIAVLSQELPRMHGAAEERVKIWDGVSGRL